MSYVTDYMNRRSLQLHTYGGLFLAARLRRLSELLYAGADDVYAEYDVTVAAAALPLLRILSDHGEPLSIGEAARRMGQSHVAISRVTRPLTRTGFIGEANDARDGRRVMLILLGKGVALLERLESIQDAMVAAIDGMKGSRALLRAVRVFEEALEEQGFAARVRAKNKRRNRSRAV